jgi:hypothetical protein
MVAEIIDLLALMVRFCLGLIAVSCYIVGGLLLMFGGFEHAVSALFFAVMLHLIARKVKRNPHKPPQKQLPESTLIPPPPQSPRRLRCR